MNTIIGNYVIQMERESDPHKKSELQQIVNQLVGNSNIGERNHVSPQAAFQPNLIKQANQAQAILQQNLVKQANQAQAILQQNLVKQERVSPTEPKPFFPSLYLFYKDQHRIGFPEVFRAFNTVKKNNSNIDMIKIDTRAQPEIVERFFEDPSTCVPQPIIKCTQPSGSLQTMTSLPKNEQDLINFLQHTKDPLFSNDSDSISPYWFNDSTIDTTNSYSQTINRRLPQLTDSDSISEMLNRQRKSSSLSNNYTDDQLPIYRSFMEEVSYDITSLFSFLYL